MVSVMVADSVVIYLPVMCNIGGNVKDFYCTQQPATSGAPYSTVLCMPVRSAQLTVVGVVLLTNKLDGTAFNKSDEHFFEVS